MLLMLVRLAVDRQRVVDAAKGRLPAAPLDKGTAAHHTVDMNRLSVP